MEFGVLGLAGNCCSQARILLLELSCEGSGLGLYEVSKSEFSLD